MSDDKKTTPPSSGNGGACADGGSPPCCHVTLSPNPLFVCAACVGGGQTDRVTATGTPGGGTFSWSSGDSSVATVAGAGNAATVTGVAPGMTNITITYSVSGHTCSASVPVTSVRVELELKNTDKIVPSPENSTYAADKRAAGGVDDLGPLPMGKGRGDAPFSGKCYISPLMIIGTVSPAPAAGLSYRWKRSVRAREWSIAKASGANKWVVKQVYRRSLSDDTGDAVFNNPNPNANRKIYIYDNPGNVYPTGNVFDNGLSSQIGGYDYLENDFIYRVERNLRGAWITCAEIHMGQKVAAKRKAATGRVPDDWDGLENSTSLATFSTEVTEAKVRAIVGGTWPIEIDANANN